MARQTGSRSDTTQPTEITQPIDNGQLEQLAAMNGAAMGAFAEVCQAYVKGVTLINEELAEFMKSRLQRDVEMGQSLAACKDLNEVVALQQSWCNDAAAEYQAQTGRLMEMATKMASESWTPVYERVNNTMQTAIKPRE